MNFWGYLKVKEGEIQQLTAQKERIQGQISVQKLRLHTIAAELVTVNTTYSLYRDCDLEEGRRVVASIGLALDACVKPKQILAKINQDFQALNQRRDALSPSDMQREKLILEARWRGAKHVLDGIQAQLSAQQNQIHTFLLLCEKIGCQPSAISTDDHERYLKAFVATNIQPRVNEQDTLRLSLQKLQFDEMEIELHCQNEKQRLSVQYRKAAYLLTGLAAAGMSGACILAALISTWALYILIVSAAAAGMAAWRGQYFFQESKKHDVSSAMLDSGLECK